MGIYWSRGPEAYADSQKVCSLPGNLEFRDYTHDFQDERLNIFLLVLNWDGSLILDPTWPTSIPGTFLFRGLIPTLRLASISLR